MSWEVRSLSEVADFNLGKMLDQNKNRGELRPYLANVNVRWGQFDLENLREMRFEDRELDRFGLLAGDILMCEGGEPGRCAIWRNQLPGMMFQKALHRIRPHSCLDSRFLYYSFLQKGRVDGFGGLFTGSTIKHLPKEKLAKVEVCFPPLPEQKRIADTLSAYDDLIENNRRRIALLEEAARQLYKEWFVRFRFPGHEHVKIIDGVPEGWTKQNLFELATATYGHAFKSDLFSDEPIGRPVVRIRDVPDRASETWTTEDAPADKTLENGDFLIGMDGDFHMNYWAGGTAWLNQRVVRLMGKGRFTTGLLRNSVEQQIKDLNETITGTTVKHLGAKHLKQIELLVPPDVLLIQANDFCDGVRNMVVNLSVGNIQLANARDLLLPKLMSGAIAV